MNQSTSDYSFGPVGNERVRWKVTAATQPNRAVVIAILLAALVCAVFAVARQTPPQPVVSSVSPSEFALNNALGHVEHIAEKPHPLGSSENAEVREYLMKTLAAEGFTPEVQQLTVMGQMSDVPVVVSNVVARLKGTAGTKAVLLVAHHDTVDRSPGAGDNGSSVAALLETLRALKAGPPLKNDVVLLFTDGEECGLLGAHGFVSQHPWSKDVGVVLNFDARGNRGPVLMFETSKNNAWVVNEFANAAPHPFTSSLFPDVYRLLPNNTDFTVFKKAGLQGLNFAFIEGHGFYHDSTDTVANLDARSVAHLGSYALSLTRHFGNLDLTNTATAGNMIYFDLLGSIVVRYTQKWAIPLALFVGALFIAVVGIALKRSHVKLSGIVQGGIAFFSTLLAVPLLIASICIVFLRLFPDIAGAHDTTTRYAQLGAFIAITIAIGVFIYGALRKRMSIEEATFGGLMWWLVGMVLTSLFLQSGSYLFTWPLLLMILAQSAFLVSKHRASRAVHLVLLSAGLLLSIVLWVPFIFHVSIAVNLMLYGLVTSVLVFVAGLFLPLLVQLLPQKS